MKGRGAREKWSGRGIPTSTFWRGTSCRPARRRPCWDTSWSSWKGSKVFSSRRGRVDFRIVPSGGRGPGPVGWPAVVGDTTLGRPRVRVRHPPFRRLPLIDLRSDTVTRPSDAMREAMARAPVGDDVYGDDPTVRSLEETVAALLGKDDAVFMPTGSMTNQVAIRCHTEPGDRVLMDGTSHVVRSEGGGPAALSGVTHHPIRSDRGVFSTEEMLEALGELHPFNPSALQPLATLVCVEHTHNAGGGRVWPLAELGSVASAAKERGLATHMDGARLWNACAATGIEAREYAEGFDTVSVCFSKALGAPVGSALAGSAALVARARRFKQLFGGGFRQAGILAAGALFALEHHRGCLGEDHTHARAFADTVSQAPGVLLDPEEVESNIVRFGVTIPSGLVAEGCHREGVHMLPSGGRALRAVFHRDVSRSDAERAAAVVSETMNRLTTEKHA